MTDLSAVEQAIAQATELKAKNVDIRLKWFKDHALRPFLLFRLAGITAIVLSAVLPALSLATYFEGKNGLVAGVSVAIAALTALGTFCRWEKTWHGRISALNALQGICAKWELEITNARVLLPDSEKVDHVYKATSDLITNTNAICTNEAEEFFNGMQFPYTETTGKAKAGKI